MTPHILSKLYERIDDLTIEIEELQRQKYQLQGLYDFSDFIETHNLIDQEIGRLQCLLRDEKARLFSSDGTDVTDGVDDIEEEEREEDSLSFSEVCVPTDSDVGLEGDECGEFGECIIEDGKSVAASLRGAPWPHLRCGGG